MDSHRGQTWFLYFHSPEGTHRPQIREFDGSPDRRGDELRNIISQLQWNHPIIVLLRQVHSTAVHWDSLIEYSHRTVGKPCTKRKIINHILLSHMTIMYLLYKDNCGNQQLNADTRHASNKPTRHSLTSECPSEHIKIMVVVYIGRTGGAVLMGQRIGQSILGVRRHGRETGGACLQTWKRAERG